MKWRRESTPDGNRWTAGRYTIESHYVDDRAYDGGRHGTQYTLSIAGEPYDLVNRLADAKRIAERIAVDVAARPARLRSTRDELVGQAGAGALS